MTETTSDKSVSREDFRQSLESALACPRDPECGLFGPGSMTWKMSRHSALFLGGFRAVLLQIAHPWVANGTMQHSAVYRDPIGRFHRTFRRVFTIVFGNMDQVADSARRMHAMHSTVKGQITSPSARWQKGDHYQANNVDALLWVAATLWDSTMKLYELVVEPLSPAEKERFYEECRLYAAVFGIPQQALPHNWSAFAQYFDDTLHSDVLHVSPETRELSDYLFSELPLSFLSAPHAKLITAELMPTHLREAFGLPPPSHKTRRIFRNSIRWFRLGYAVLPPQLRYVPSYHEAQARLESRSRSPRVTRIMSRLWIGQPELVFATRGLVGL